MGARRIGCSPWLAGAGDAEPDADLRCGDAAHLPRHCSERFDPDWNRQGSCHCATGATR